jgi:proline dehydrogenase
MLSVFRMYDCYGNKGGSMRIYRSGMLYLSRNKWLQDKFQNTSIGQKISRRWVAGESLDDAVNAVKALNSNKIMATIAYLGENVSDSKTAVEAVKQCKKTIKSIRNNNLNANISEKFTHLGLGISYDLAYNNSRALLQEASRYGVFVRFDREGSEYGRDYVRLIKELSAEFDNFGLVIQASLYSSAEEVDIFRNKLSIRLCKGAYSETKAVAFQNKSEVDNNFSCLIEELLGSKMKHGIATHDSKLIEKAMDYASKKKIATGHFEFQMLYGIRKDIQQFLTENGYDLRIYVGYGEQWYPYMVRRLAENPRNLWFVIKNIV